MIMLYEFYLMGEHQSTIMEKTVVVRYTLPVEPEMSKLCGYYWKREQMLMLWMNGVTALQVALDSGYDNVAEMLRQNGADDGDLRDWSLI